MPDRKFNPSPFDRSTEIRVNIAIAFVVLVIIAVAFVVWLP